LQPNESALAPATRDAINKVLVRARSLGLWHRDNPGKSFSFEDAIGWQGVVEVVLGKPGKKGSRTEGQCVPGVKFDGVHPLHHRKCPECWRVASTAAAAGVTAPARGPWDDI
jgi:hypothetical protein